MTTTATQCALMIDASTTRDRDDALTITPTASGWDVEVFVANVAEQHAAGSLDHPLVAQVAEHRAVRFVQSIADLFAVGVVGLGDVDFAQILDAGLEELVAALAALAEYLPEIGVAARRAGAAGDVVEADGNGEFRPQAKLLAGFAFSEKDAAAKVFAGHVEERVGRLHDGDVGEVRAALGEQGQDVGCKGGNACHVVPHCLLPLWEKVAERSEVG